MKRFLTVVCSFIVLFSLNIFISGQGNRDLRKGFNQPVRTALDLARIEAFSDGKGVWIYWQTEFETGNLGFNIYRVSDEGISLVNPNMIGGAYLSSLDEITYGKEYSFFDPAGSTGSSYYIESFGLDGVTRNHSHFTARYVADLTEKAGVSSEFLRNAAQTAEPLKITGELNLPPDLKNSADASRSSFNTATQQWIANQPGVKIGVRKNGFYRIPRADLENAGFDTTVDPALWQLYTDGIEQAMIIGPNADYIEFYGQNVDTPLTGTRIYYLLAGAENGKRIGSKIVRPVAGNVVGKTYNKSFELKQRLFYISDYLNGETENFFGSIITANNTNINFEISAKDSSSPKTDFTLEIGGLTASNHLLEVKLNDEILGQMSWSGKTVKTQTFSIPLSFIQNGNNVLTLKSLIPSGDVSLFGSLKFDFPREYVAEQNQLHFYTNNSRVTNVTGFTTQDVRLFDVTYPNTPVLVENVQAFDNGNNGFDLRIPANRAYIMYAVEDSALLQPATIVENEPSTLSDNSNQGEFIIITHRSLLEQANVWADYRSAGGMNVKVIDVEDIFDEYNFGQSSSNAIRDFLNFAKSSWQTPPNYVMLLGDSTFDPKNYLGNGFMNQVPTQMVDTVYLETGSDESLADFNNDGLAEIAIGRVSARTPQEATDIFNKVVHFETNLSTAYDRGFMFVSDLPNGYDFQGVSIRLRNELPTGTNSTMVYRGDADARTQVLNGWNSGKYLINWTGHGTTGLWAASSFFGNPDIPNLTNTEYSIMTALTCLNGYFLDPQFSGLGENALKVPNKGTVASWASTGLTTPDIQEIMGRRFFNRLGAGTIPRLGDLIRDAKTQIPAGRDVRLSWALLGDPTLVVRPLNPPARQPSKMFLQNDN